ncbi:hypothetical protein SSTU70S_06704 [Stutzerimonas stutzeri]
MLALPTESFQHLTGRHVNQGKNDSTWRLRAQLDNRLAGALGGFIEINYPLLDHIELYLQYPNGSLSRQLSGDHYPLTQRPVKIADFWFPVELPTGNTTLLLRLKTSSTLYVPLYFSSYTASAAAQEELLGMSGAFYGVLFAMFCYNLFLFVSLREPAYFWYLIYNLNVGLFALAFDGLLIKWLPDNSTISTFGIYLLMYSHCLVAIQFSRHFLHTREHFPHLHAACAWRCWRPSPACFRGAAEPACLEHPGQRGGDRHLHRPARHRRLRLAQRRALRAVLHHRLGRAARLVHHRDHRIAGFRGARAVRRLGGQGRGNVRADHPLAGPTASTGSRKRLPFAPGCRAGTARTRPRAASSPR